MVFPSLEYLFSKGNMQLGLMTSRPKFVCSGELRGFISVYPPSFFHIHQFSIFIWQGGGGRRVTGIINL